jgi:hypothetical protein
VKAMHRGKFIALITFIRKGAVSKINNVSTHLRKAEKEHFKSKVSPSKEIIKI